MNAKEWEEELKAETQGVNWPPGYVSSEEYGTRLSTAAGSAHVSPGAWGGGRAAPAATTESGGAPGTTAQWTRPPRPGFHL